MDPETEPLGKQKWHLNCDRSVHKEKTCWTSQIVVVPAPPSLTTKTEQLRVLKLGLARNYITGMKGTLEARSDAVGVYLL